MGRVDRQGCVCYPDSVINLGNKVAKTSVKIKELDISSLEYSAQIIRTAFGRVTAQFGITQVNAPMYSAYTTVEKLKEMTARGASFYGYFLDGRQVGVVALEARKASDSFIKGHFMERLAVLPEYWHSGIGREMVDFIIERAGELGVKKLFLGIVNENKILKEWYQGMSFREVAVKRFPHLPFTVCFMAIEI
jgi:diamine N-acetyltransferase